MTPENITTLQELIQADPALAEQLQSATTMENAAKLLAQAASQKGIAIDADAIADHIARVNDVQMPDSELEALAGGGLVTLPGFVMMTMFSFGIAGVAYSVINNGGTGKHICKFK